VEPTEVSVATDGELVNVYARVFDDNPEEMVSGAMYRGERAPFQDDSLEFFFCAGRHAMYYYQIVASHTGETYIAKYLNTLDDPWTMIEFGWEPDELELDVQIVEDGYIVQFSLPAKSMDLPKLEDGAEFQMQVVRNYRGQNLTKFPDSILLQLFPNHIYANRSYYNNHHRDCFGMVRVEQREEPPQSIEDEPGRPVSIPEDDE